LAAVIPRDLADVRLAPDELQGGSGIVQSRAKQRDYSAAAVLVAKGLDGDLSRPPILV